MVNFLVQCNKMDGFGHFKRSSRLAHYFCSHGIAAHVHNLDVQVPHPSTFKDGITFIDLPRSSRVDISRILNSATITIGMDWFGDYLLDYNIVIYPHLKPMARKQVFSGFDYIIVDPAISSLEPPQAPLLRKKGLIVIGGGDLKNGSTTIAEKLTDEGYEVHLVLGKFSRRKINTERFTVSVDVQNMGQIISGADWMVTNGGGCLFEALCSGRAAIAMPQTSEEEAVVEYCKTCDAILGTDLNKLSAASDEKWQEVVSNGLSLVDGKGAARILSIVRSVI